MITAIEIGGGGEQMHVRRGPFRWPWQCAGATRSTSPNASWPGLRWKPLDATIGQLLAQYCPGGRQGDSKRCNDATCTHFAGHFDGRGDAAVWYRVHCPMEEVCGFHKSHLTPPSDEHYLRYYKRNTPSPVVSDISLRKRAPVEMLAPNNNRGMTYQTDEKHWTNLRESFVGVVKLAIYCYNNLFLLRVFTNNLLKYLQMWHRKNS